MNLKFNSILDLSDARYAAAAMAEWIGFSVGQDNSLSPAQIQEIIGWCSGPKLILEVPDHFPVGKIRAYLDVLPVDGLEIAPEDLDEYAGGFPGLIFILRADQVPESDGRIFSHSALNSGAPNHIFRADARQSHVAEIQNISLAAISLTCYPSDNPALKNYDEWNDFLEELGMI